MFTQTFRVMLSETKHLAQGLYYLLFSSAARTLQETLRDLSHSFKMTPDAASES